MDYSGLVIFVPCGYLIATPNMDIHIQVPQDYILSCGQSKCKCVGRNTKQHKKKHLPTVGQDGRRKGRKETQEI